MNARARATWERLLDEQLEGLDVNNRADRMIFALRLEKAFKATKLSEIRGLISALDGHPPGLERDRESVIRQLGRMWCERAGWDRPEPPKYMFTPKIPVRSPRVWGR